MGTTMNQGSGIPVTKRVSIWNQPLKVDFKEPFKALSKAAAHVATAKWDEIATDAIDSLAALGLDNDLGQLAWLLIRRALTQAAFDLARENIKFVALTVPSVPEDLCDKLDFSLEQANVTIDRAFFEHPRNLPILREFEIPFKQWLMGYGLTDAYAAAVAARLPGYFVFALSQEWRRKPQTYARIREAIDTPFTAAGEREQAWIHYNAWLQKQIDESVLNEPFSLKQIYISLRAYYEEKGDSNELSGLREATNKETRRIAVDAREELDRWLDRADGRDSVRVISGGPGSGKSSFTRMYAAYTASKSFLRVLYIPLHQLDPKADLVIAVGDFVRRAGLLAHNPLDPGSAESRLLILFDGLDELSMQGRIGAEVARGFVEEVIRTVGVFNMQQTRLQVVITGREIVIQANANKFRKTSQILHLLPYFVDEEERSGYDDYGNLLAEDQRQVWWVQYGAATGLKYDSIPRELQREDLDEMTSQPLVNFLLALSYARGKLDFSVRVNLNSIYEDLLQAIYERAYATTGTHPGIREMKRSDFIRILEEIGLTAWRGDGQTTTISEIHKRCQAAGLTKLLETFKEGAEAGVTQLLTAFYFRQHGHRRDGEPTFEFTHKSFGEYLTARRLLLGIKTIHGERQRHANSPDTGWTERDCLRHWAELIREAPRMTTDIHQFVMNEMALQKEDIVSQFQDTICELIGFMIRRGMPMEQISPRLGSYREESITAIAAEEAFLAVLYACALVTRRVSKINWWMPESRDLAQPGEWLSRLIGQRIFPSNVLTLECLGYLDLRGAIMHMRDFFHANFYYSDLEGAELYYAILSFAKLREVNLKNAGLSYTHLEAADLRGADLRGANLRAANLQGAHLEYVYLERASLIKAVLKEANADYAKLEEANLKGANLEGARFSNANLEKANLQGANLTDAKGLTQEQVDSAIGDERTMLPAGLTMPKSWKKKGSG
jgi:uncharacterized protein YjbI with pentapeptide repeats